MNRHEFLLALFVALLLGCGGPGVDNSNEKRASDEPGDSITKIVKEAYIFGFPLVVMDITKRQMTNPAAGPPVNQFRHNSSFPDASFKNVVRPNADTYYSIAWVDLSKQPIILSVPNTHGRYYMMPMMDAYSNVFASPGTRTTGTEAGRFLIAGPTWKGEVRSGMQRINSPTTTVWIIGRTQVNSKRDGEKVVVPLQQQYKLTSLSAERKGHDAPNSMPDSVPKGDPNTILKKMPITEYFNYLNGLLGKNPPSVADEAAIRRFASLGIGAGKKFDLNTFPASERAMMANIPKDVFATFDLEKSSSDILVNGWNVGRKVIGTYGTDYYSRASTAYFGLGANLRADAIYPSCYFDGDGHALNGTNNYIMHFDKGRTPPVNAFWSLTLYGTDGYFVENSIHRYTLGDRSNLKVNGDGSIDIYIQKNNPGNNKTANWLPAPDADFNLLLRVYWPKEEVLNGKWFPPAVQKVK